MIYKKATAEVVLFDNTDILMGPNSGDCSHKPTGKGWMRGECTGASGNKSGIESKNGLREWRDSRAGF